VGEREVTRAQKESTGTGRPANARGGRGIAGLTVDQRPLPQPKFGRETDVAGE
jgi:hypothetical protein